MTLPRLLVFTDGAIRRRTDLDRVAGSLAAAGPDVGLVARDHVATAAELAAFARRLFAAAEPGGARLVVAGRPDIAAAVGAHGVHLRAGDLAPADARPMLPHGWLGRSAHSMAEAGNAVREGADFLVVGNIWETASHPGYPAAGLDLVAGAADLGRPVFAIGGVTPARASAVRDAGAWGVAVIRACWDAIDPEAAARALLSPWSPW